MRSGVRATGQQSRFAATIHPGPSMDDVRGLDAFDLDRFPSPPDHVRALVTADECARLLDLGFEVRLNRHYPVKPLDPSLIAPDEAVDRWFEERLASLPPNARPRPRRKVQRG